MSFILKMEVGEPNALSMHAQDSTSSVWLPRRVIGLVSTSQEERGILKVRQAVLVGKSVRKGARLRRCLKDEMEQDADAPRPQKRLKMKKTEDRSV
jgi:hypothetical protein